MISSDERRAVALSILSQEGENLTRKAGSFLGQIVADSAPLTPKQAAWFFQLAERAGYEIEGVEQ